MTKKKAGLMAIGILLIITLLTIFFAIQNSRNGNVSAILSTQFLIIISIIFVLFTINAIISNLFPNSKISKLSDGLYDLIKEGLRGLR